MPIDQSEAIAQRTSCRESQMLVHELLMYLTINKKGKIQKSTTGSVSSALRAAILIDLALAKKIVFENEIVKVKDSSPIGNKFMDLILSKIAKEKKQMTAKEWVSALTSDRELESLKKNVVAFLADIGVLTRESMTTYSVTNEDYRDETQQIIRCMCLVPLQELIILDHTTMKESTVSASSTSIAPPAQGTPLVSSLNLASVSLSIERKVTHESRKLDAFLKTKKIFKFDFDKLKFVIPMTFIARGSVFDPLFSKQELQTANKLVASYFKLVPTFDTKIVSLLPLFPGAVGSMSGISESVDAAFDSVKVVALMNSVIYVAGSIVK